MSESKGCSVQLGGLWAVPAVVISVALNHSVWWALFHFLCGGFYVLYAVLFRAKEIIPALRAMFGVS